MPQVWVNGKIIEGPSAQEILPSVLKEIRLPGDGDLLPPINFAAVAGWDDWDAALAAGLFCLAAPRLEAKALIALPEPIREKFVQQGFPPEIVVGIGEKLANLMLERWSAPRTTAHRTRLIIFGSSKGGLGKTSLALLASGHEMAHGRFVAVVDMDPNGSMGTVVRQRAEEDSHLQHSGPAYIHSPPSFLAPRLFFARASWEAGSDEGVHLALALALRPDAVVVDMSGDLETSRRGLERFRFWAGMAGAQISVVQAVVLVAPQRDLMDQAIRAIEMYGSALSTRLRAFRSALRRRSARFPPRIPFPRRRNPSRIAFASSAASAYTPFGRVRARPLPLFFTRRPPSASSNRRQSCSFPGPTTTLKGSPSSFTQTRAFVPFRFLCPSTPTPSPPFFASTSVESTATASTFPFPSVYPQFGRACRILCQTPFSWSS
jgi:hypothetical protein